MRRRWTLDVDFSRTSARHGPDPPDRRRDAEWIPRRRRPRRPAPPRPAGAGSGRRRSRPGRRRRSRPWPAARSLHRARGRGRVTGSASCGGCMRAKQPSGMRHDRLARAELADLLDGVRAVLVVVELVADELLGLEHVRRDHVRLRAHGAAQRVAVGVDDRSSRSAAAARGSGTRRCRCPPRAGASRRRRTALAPLARYRSLSTNSSTSLRGDLRALLVDLGLLAGRRVDHGGVGARLLADADEVGEHGSCVSWSTMRVPVAPPARPGGDHRRAERLEHAGDVDALAARHRRLLDGPVAAAEPEVRAPTGLVDGRVERDGDDHAARAPRGGVAGGWSERGGCKQDRSD